jgi:hypothetical protein
VRGLARAVEARGGVIYEQTAVTAVGGGSRPVLRTNAGEVVARKAVALAGEALYDPNEADASSAASRVFTHLPDGAAHRLAMVCGWLGARRECCLRT